jgi:hypothetical protein
MGMSKQFVLLDLLEQSLRFFVEAIQYILALAPPVKVRMLASYSFGYAHAKLEQSLYIFCVVTFCAMFEEYGLQ